MTSPSEAPCPRCGQSCPVGAHQSAHCTRCMAGFRTDVHDCGRCGARTFGAPCDCARPKDPAHEVQRLFEPAPVQLAGQLTMGDA